MTAQPRTKLPLREELPRLLAGSRGHSPRSLRQLADEIAVSQSYLSRVLNAKSQRRPASVELVGRIAAAFDLPADYFPEYRASLVIEAARDEPALLDAAYDRLIRR